MIDFSVKLKNLRIETKLTQKQIAEKLGMSETGYASWEQGLSEPSIDNLRKLCLIHNISPNELLDIQDDGDRKALKDFYGLK